MGGKGSGGHNRKPSEVKRALGNPGKGPLPAEGELVLLPTAQVTEPLRVLGRHGRDTWDLALRHASAWLANSDLEQLQLLCEAVDEYQMWRGEAIGPVDPLNPNGKWRAQRRVDDLRRQISLGLSELGLTPIGRSRLGVAEVRIREGVDRLSTGRHADLAEF